MGEFGGARWYGEVASPLDIAGCALWLDASQLELEDGDQVAVWPDLSGSGYDATQATADNRPVFKTSAQNGLSVVRFDPSEDPQYLSLGGAGDLLRGLDGFTVAVACGRVSNIGDYVFSVSTGDDVGASRLYVQVSNQLDVHYKPTDAGGSVDNVMTPWDANLDPRPPVACLFAVDGANGHIAGLVSNDYSGFVTDSTAPEMPPAGPTDDTASLAVYVGAAAGDLVGTLEGDVFEIVVWQRALSAKERRQVVEYMSSRWGTL